MTPLVPVVSARVNSAMRRRSVFDDLINLCGNYETRFEGGNVCIATLPCSCRIGEEDSAVVGIVFVL